MTYARHALLALLLALLLVSAGCGEDAGPRPHRGKPSPEPEVSIVLLDPGGRLLDVGKAPLLFLVAEGTATRVTTWRDDRVHELETLPPAGTELLVLVPGCRPARVALANGRNVVRLEAGFRVRVAISGQRPALPPGGRANIRLSIRTDTIGEIQLPGDVELDTIAANAFEADTPSHPQFVVVPADGLLDVFVPIAGPYELAWDVRADNWASSSGADGGPIALDPDTGSLDLVWPTQSLEQTIQRMQKGR